MITLDTTLVALDEDHCIATFGGTLLQVWRRSVRHAATLKLRVAAQALAARRQGPLSSFVIVEPGSSLPDSAARAELSRVHVDLGPRCVGIAFAQEGEGFNAAAVRGVLTGMLLVTRPPVPCVVFKTFSAAGLWLRGLHALRGDSSASTLVERIAQLREGFEHRRAG